MNGRSTAHALALAAGLLGAGLLGACASQPAAPGFAEARARCRAEADRLVGRERVAEFDRVDAEDPLRRQLAGPVAAARRDAIARRERITERCLQSLGYGRDGQRILPAPASPVPPGAMR
ncbi:MAG: hypothetical protein IT557_08000 [Alphaproteobacteria bacterium]|nr:hypothetical protein [Alphaproteobacteria bacterium]